MNNSKVRNENDEIEIDVLALIKFFWSKALVILVVMVAFAVLTIGGTFLFISPKYESTAVLIANNSNFSLGETSFSISESLLSAANSLAGTYLRILNSRTTLERVIKESGVDYDYEELSEMLESETYTDAKGMFEVTVKSENPIEAENIANTIAKVLPDRIGELVDGSSVRIVDYAIVPAHAASPSYTKNTIIGALAGLVLICLIYTVKFINNSDNLEPITSEADISEYFPDIPVLGLIPNVHSKEKDGYYSSYYGTDENKKNSKNSKKKEDNKKNDIKKKEDK